MIYEIAGLKVDMNPIHERMRKQSECYLSSGDPVIHVYSNPMDEDRVVMEDFNSKFGTLVLLQCPSMEILQGQMLTVQVGRSYFEISIKEPFSLFGCCTAREFDKKKSTIR